jgi:hypothetical protein
MMKITIKAMIIKTLLPKRKTAGNLLENLDTMLLSDDTLDAVEEIIKERNNSLTESAILPEDDS